MGSYTSAIAYKIALARVCRVPSRVSMGVNGSVSLNIDITDPQLFHLMFLDEERFRGFNIVITNSIDPLNTEVDSIESS